MVTLSEVGKAGQSMPDEGVLNFARADGRAALTLNRKHFVRLHGAAIGTEAPLSGKLIRINRPAR